MSYYFYCSLTQFTLHSRDIKPNSHPNHAELSSKACKTPRNSIYVLDITPHLLNSVFFDIFSKLFHSTINCFFHYLLKDIVSKITTLVLVESEEFLCQNYKLINGLILQINITCVKIDFPITSLRTFPLVFLRHTSPPDLKLCACFSHVLYQFLI